jgi:hypothetical protein
MARRKLTQDDARRLALRLPEAHEGAHMGHADLRVRNRIFASLPNDPRRVVVKITPAHLDLLKHADPDTFRDVWGGRWLAIELDRVAPSMLEQLLADAWDLTAPKTLVKARQGLPAGARRKPLRA